MEDVPQGEALEEDLACCDLYVKLQIILWTNTMVFFEELFYTLFRPSTTKEAVNHHTDNEYYAAQNLGRKCRGKCKQLFPD
ncbi:hypothetical protein NQ314_002968, partial [Rhamnusium bicolor]